MDLSSIFPYFFFGFWQVVAKWVEILLQLMQSLVLLLFLLFLLPWDESLPFPWGCSVSSSVVIVVPLPCCPGDWLGDLGAPDMLLTTCPYPLGLCSTRSALRAMAAVCFLMITLASSHPLESMSMRRSYNRSSDLSPWQNLINLIY